MKDFTLEIYEKLLTSLKKSQFEFQTFEEFLKAPKKRVVVLRHDVDDKKYNSLEFAKIQNSMGISATYFFRIVPQSFDASVINEIYCLGHEIGYHYEDMDLCDGEIEEAIKSFEKHLIQLRKIAPVSTICMHGSPRSKFDNRELWGNHDYKKFDLIGEPYFDLNFESVFYATDTGRMWDGKKYSIRDFSSSMRIWPIYHSTNDIIEAINGGLFPEQAMLTFHPQRWTNLKMEWYGELIKQQVKNFIKFSFFKKS